MDDADDIGGWSIAPSVSIVIPTHNRPHLLGRAVRSALAACPASGTVVVVDDASQVPAAEVLAPLTAGDARLRVVRNTAGRGAANARNFGVQTATGTVIVFLDDDDEMMPDYCRRVLAAAGSADFGFSAVLLRTQTVPPTEVVTGRRYPTGVLPQRAPLRHKIAGLGAGFWIGRDLFGATGGFDPAQTVDEDTDLCCALIGDGRAIWYDAVPGVVVHRGHAGPADPTGQLTSHTPATVVAACYRRTWDRHEARFAPLSGARWFLATRYVRRAVKSGDRSGSLRFALHARPRAFAACLAFYWGIKMLSMTVQRTR